MQSIKMRLKSIRMFFVFIIVITFLSLYYMRKNYDSVELVQQVGSPSIVYSIIIDVT
jgi:hypothetical protein